VSEIFFWILFYFIFSERRNSSLAIKELTFLLAILWKKKHNKMITDNIFSSLDHYHCCAPSFIAIFFFEFFFYFPSGQHRKREHKNITICLRDKRFNTKEDRVKKWFLNILRALIWQCGVQIKFTSRFNLIVYFMPLQFLPKKKEKK
jgi:hypothetical protein